MKTKINFHNMDHSEALEAHALKKLIKLDEFCADDAMPLSAEIWLKAEVSHPHHKTDLQVKVNKQEFHTSSEARDLYVALDEAVDKMVILLKKSKDMQLCKDRCVQTEKRMFKR